jgi:hypothetical protein
MEENHKAMIYVVAIVAIIGIVSLVMIIKNNSVRNVADLSDANVKDLSYTNTEDVQVDAAGNALSGSVKFSCKGTGSFTMTYFCDANVGGMDITAGPFNIDGLCRCQKDSNGCGLEPQDPEGVCSNKIFRNGLPVSASVDVTGRGSCSGQCNKYYGPATG